VQTKGTTVRFVARFAIAIATLISSALFCWGQPPTNAFGGGRPAAQNVSQPSLTPPDSTTGTWIADDDVVDEVTSPVQPPEQLGIDPFEIDQSMAEGGGDCDCEQCSGGDCEGGGGAPGHGHGAGCCGPLWCSDMWNEVHAHRRIYFEVDYMSLWTKGNPLPPLVTTSPLGTPQAQAGRLPVSATTEILFGNDRVDDGQRNGGRINVGYWLVDGEFLGVEGQYFTLEEGSTDFDRLSMFSTGDPNAIILARPFINNDPILPEPTEDAAIIAFPNPFNLGPGTGTLDGSVDIRTTSYLQSAGALLRKLVWIDFTMQRRLDLLLGYRFLRVEDSVTINDQSTFIPSAGPIPETTFTSQDIFSARNFFNGGEIGLKYQSQHGRLGVELIAKSAFGNNRQKTYINGSNTITAGGMPIENVGGLLAQPSNIGSYQRDVFAILPEANANLRWDVTCNIRATIGYTFLYINRIQRSGDAINLNLNPTQINGGELEGAAEPAFFSTDSTWWAHGATAGVEVRW
jgi:hypothetical protein